MKLLNLLGMPWFWNFLLHLFFGGAGIYLLARHLNLGKASSAISAIAFSLMPHITAMLVHGHGSQIMSIAYIPWVFYGYIKIRDDVTLKNLGIFSLLVGLQILRGHPQIAYYTWLMLGICFLIDLFYMIIRKQKNIKWIAFTLSGLCLGILSSLSVYIPSLSYLSYSTRSSGIGGGMGFEKATEYSFSFGEISTFFIPSFYGFGSDAYWGSMKFTNFPNYMGIIILLFAFYGIIRYKWTRFKIFCIISAILFLILSFGGSFYEFFYNNFFYFDKFRNPMYLLIIVQFCIVMLSGMGFTMALKDIKNQKIVLPIYSCICIFVFSLIFFSFKAKISDSVSVSDITEHRRSQIDKIMIKKYPSESDKAKEEAKNYMDSSGEKKIYKTKNRANPIDNKR